MSRIDAFVIGMILGGAIIIVILLGTYGNVYKRGQIDALSGNIAYELVKQPNGETVWQKND